MFLMQCLRCVPTCAECSWPVVVDVLPSMSSQVHGVRVLSLRWCHEREGMLTNMRVTPLLISATCRAVWVPANDVVDALANHGRRMCFVPAPMLLMCSVSGATVVSLEALLFWTELVENEHTVLVTVEALAGGDVGEVNGFGLRCVCHSDLAMCSG